MQLQPSKGGPKGLPEWREGKEKLLLTTPTARHLQERPKQCLQSSGLPLGRPISVKRIAFSGLLTEVLHNTLSVALSASETVVVWATARMEYQGTCFL